MAISLASFADITPVLDAALTHSGVQFKLENKNKAIQWRQRAYRYRKALLNLSAERMKGIPGFSPSTPYDQLRIDIGDEGEVVIAPIPPVPRLMDLEGNFITIEKPQTEDDNEDALAAFATQLAEKS